MLLNTVKRGCVIFGKIWYSSVNLGYRAFSSAADYKIKNDCFTL
jgi:hypothetical protein